MVISGTDTDTDQTVLVRVAFSRRWNLCHHLIFFASRGLIELYMGRGCLWDSAKQYPAAGQRYLVVLMHEVHDFILTYDCLSFLRYHGYSLYVCL